MAHPRAGAIVVVVAAALLGGWWLAGTRAVPAPQFVVINAVDGDTIDVAGPRGAERVRLLGVDTPEIHDGPPDCFGVAAARHTATRLVGQSVALVLDEVRRDKYGRLLAYVVLHGHRYNDELLRFGYARLLVIPPNGRFGRVQLRAELDARAHGRGLWSAC
jgi:micrococcal nuclease